MNQLTSFVMVYGIKQLKIDRDGREVWPHEPVLIAEALH